MTSPLSRLLLSIIIHGLHHCTDDDFPVRNTYQYTSEPRTAALRILLTTHYAPLRISQTLTFRHFELKKFAVFSVTVAAIVAAVQATATPRPQNKLTVEWTTGDDLPAPPERNALNRDVMYLDVQDLAKKSWTIREEFKFTRVSLSDSFAGFTHSFKGPGQCAFHLVQSSVVNEVFFKSTQSNEKGDILDKKSVATCEVDGKFVFMRATKIPAASNDRLVQDFKVEITAVGDNVEQFSRGEVAIVRLTPGGTIVNKPYSVFKACFSKPCRFDSTADVIGRPKHTLIFPRPLNNILAKSYNTSAQEFRLISSNTLSTNFDESTGPGPTGHYRHDFFVENTRCKFTVIQSREPPRLVVIKDKIKLWNRNNLRKSVHTCTMNGIEDIYKLDIAEDHNSANLTFTHLNKDRDTTLLSRAEYTLVEEKYSFRRTHGGLTEIEFII